MEDWSEEVAGDLGSARGLLEELLASLSGEPTADQVGALWQAYVLIEKSVFFTRVQLGSESPGAAVKASAYGVPDERQAVAFALSNLREGEAHLRAGQLEFALKRLRESRNYVRVLLRDKRRAKLRERAPRRGQSSP
jgi:hypothetical protein